MQLIDIAQRGALVTLLALCTHTGDFEAERALEVGGDGDDPNLLGRAGGLWLASAQRGDERQLLVGHFRDDVGEASLALLATLVPEKGTCPAQSAGRGRLYGELRLVGGGEGLGDAVSKLLQSGASSELAIGIAGSWIREESGAGRFDAVVYAQDEAFGAAVPVALLRGEFAAGLGSGAEDDEAWLARPLSAANPFGVSVSGTPAELEAATDLYHPLLAAESDVAGGDPFSVPPRSIQEGDFVALMLGIED